MISSAQSLKDKAKEFATKNNLEVQVVLQNFMFERFLERLSISNYKDNFILKGGFLLSSIMGISVRSTMDIDANITGINFDEMIINKIVNDIASINLNDGVTFIVDKEKIIKEDNEYGGYSYKIIGKFQNIIIPFNIDISTGDIVTPNAIEYKYKMLLEDSNINLKTYNYETIIAEKIQIVLARGILNSRMKDFYDLYYFKAYKWQDIDVNILKKAINITFKHRNTINDLENINTIISNISSSKDMNIRWKAYQKRFKYARDLSFDDVLNKIKEIYDLIK